MDHKCVVVLEDDQDLAALVTELLSEENYDVVTVTDPETLLSMGQRRHPCVALVDSISSSHFDLWWLGPRLAALGVPAIAFTAHIEAQREFEADTHGFVGVISKPFDAEEFLRVVDTICWDDHKQAAS